MEENYITIIAEAGVNHNGDFGVAIDLIDAAAEAGADIVKFQTFRAQDLLVRDAEKAGYQKNNTGGTENQFEMLKKLELSHEVHHKLLTYCKKKKIQFLSTAFDRKSLIFLTRSLQLKLLKIPSGEITNGPLLLQYAKSGCDLILSTGMATLVEIEEALSVIAFGLLALDMPPSANAFQSAFKSQEGQNVLQEKVTLLHCTSHYPAPYKDINLNAIQTMKNAFGLRVGLSDHSQGIVVPLVATGLGVCMIEKHFTIDKTMQGPDHVASINPDELLQMVREIRMAQQTFGTGRKEPQESEIPNIEVARKSLVAGRDISKNELFNKENLTSKRPGSGMSPMKYWDFIDKPAARQYKIDEFIGV